MRFSRHREFVLALWTGLVLLLPSIPVWATTFHVSPFGSNTPPYSSYATAAHDVADAFLASSGYGDTVIVHSGTYPVDTTIYVPAGLVWIGVGKDSVVFEWTDVESESGLFIFRLDQENDISGMEFYFPAGTSFRKVFGIFVYSPISLAIRDCRFHEVLADITGSGDIEIHNCEFIYGQGHGITIGTSEAWLHHNSFFGRRAGDAILVLDAGNILVEDSYFNSYGLGGLACCPNAVTVEYAGEVTVRNNLMLNSGEPVSFRLASGVVENNTMIRANGISTGIPPIRANNIVINELQSVIMRNNVMQDFTSHWALGNRCDTCPPSGPITFVHNAIWPPTDTLYVYYPGRSAEDITIIDSANYNLYPMFSPDSTFEPQAGSPLIDSGDPAVLDVDGTRSDIGWTGGPQGIEVSYSELAPEPPESIWVNGSQTLVSVQWSARPEADLAGYRLYRGLTSGFWTPGLTPIREFPVGDTSAADTLLVADQSFYYVVTAFDTSDLESQASPEGQYVLTSVFDDPEIPAVPRTPAIRRAYPNPFNAAVTIEVFIPDIGAQPAPVEVLMYNLLGQVHSIAFYGSLESGEHQITWDGRAGDGAPSASGMYFARLRVWGVEFGAPEKIVLLK